MKLKIIILLLSCFFFFTHKTTAQGDLSSETLDLNIRITNLKEVTGSIFIGVFNNKESFPKDGHQFRILYEAVTQNPMTYTIEDLPVDEYAVAVFQDINEDKECNLNFIGIPKEPYGFSNDIKPRFSAPSFKKTKFKLIKGDTLAIKLFH